jgi:hypothetical protein
MLPLQHVYVVIATWPAATRSRRWVKRFSEGSGQCCREGAGAVVAAEIGNFLGICEKNVPVFEQNQEKPEKTCGNRRKGVDKARGKAEGELRYGSPHPHEHW